MSRVCSDERLTLEMSATHHIPQAKNIPYQYLLIKPVFSLLAKAEKDSVFSKLVFQCPLSPYLFILAAQLLAATIRQNKKQVELLNKNEFKVSQYADDTILILESREIRNIVSNCTRNNRNVGKIFDVKLSGKGNQQNCVLKNSLNAWLQNKIKTLGVWRSMNPEITRAINY